MFIDMCHSLHMRIVESEDKLSRYDENERTADKIQEIHVRYHYFLGGGGAYLCTNH